ncbi:MAG: nucleotide sugar dehydrogenase [Endomicrobium sp.]|jgi:UDPglucose 6-dehydrogenase|nr:nucleotide sugar dehydrogenase [Endomicrobium sp.]
MISVSVLGLGFVGLTTALGFSEKGIRTYAYDVDKNKLNMIKNNNIPFYEANLENVLKKNNGKNFILAYNIEDAVKNSKIIFICVGTPSDKNGKADLGYIKSALDSILSVISKDEKKIIVIKSTIPPSTTQNEIIPYVKSKNFDTGKDIYITNNPEFLREGCAWADFFEPDRIVIGTNDDYAKEYLSEIYKDFGVQIHFVSLNTGEFVKYLSNTFLAATISYSNEMSMIANSIGGIDIKSAFEIFHQDKRWNGLPASMASYAYPGCGFGGYCLPKDTLALVQKAFEFNYDAKILRNILSVNDEIKPFWIKKILRQADKNEVIAVLGLSFKPNSDDVRQTPALNIINLLIEAGYKNITAYDPVANDLLKKTYPLAIEYAGSMAEAVAKSKFVVLVTAWEEFKNNKNLLKDKTVFDLRYFL